MARDLSEQVRNGCRINGHPLSGQTVDSGPISDHFLCFWPDLKIRSGPNLAQNPQPGARNPQPGLQVPELFLSGPHSGTFFCKCFVAFPDIIVGISRKYLKICKLKPRLGIPGKCDEQLAEKNPEWGPEKSSGICRPGWGFRAKFGPDLIFKSGQKHQKWSEMGPESTVWAETWSRSMPGPFRSLWDGSNPLQGAVPGEKSKKVCPSRPRISRSIHNPW